MNDWRQLLVEPAAEVRESVEQWLESRGALAITLQDAGDEPLLEPPPGAMPLWQQTRVIALFEGDADVAAIASALAADFPAHVLGAVSLETLENRVWELEWRRDFHPMRFGERLWITPPDGRDTLPGNAVAVTLEPGLAFGTGTHPTPALCLRWLDSRADALAAAPELLDYGCGSGILAIAAARLGARASATDLDAQALTACADNAQRNAVTLDAIHAVAALPRRTWDIIIANILAGTLMHLAPELAARTRAGGDLVLSGLLHGQVDAVVDAYAEWFDLLPPARLGDWALLHGVRRRERGLALAHSMTGK